MTKPSRISREELAAEGAIALPDKEVLSLLDLNANLDLAIDAAAPIDLAVAANANIAAPITAAVQANLLSPDAVGVAQTDQAAGITQHITGDSTATSPQTSVIDQAATSTGTTTGSTTGGSITTDPLTGDTSISGSLLDVNVNLNGSLNLAAPIDGAVAAQANAAAPIDAAVSANIGSPGAESVAVADQTALIDQTIDGNATATADQVSSITQGAGTGSTTTP